MSFLFYEMSEINWKDKCWVTTIFLVNGDRKVLLTWNKNLQTWIPVGGHIDEGETPEDAIKREVKEETGFEFKFYRDSHEENDGHLKVIKPYRFQVEEVSHHGRHMNFVFLGKCLSYDANVVETDEKEKLRWFSEDEIKNEKVMLENVRKTALEALRLID